MPNCIECDQPVPTRIKIEGKRHNLKNRKRCLDCSPFKSFHGGKYPPRKNGSDSKWSCSKHPDASVAKRSSGRLRCRTCAVEYVTNKRRKNSAKLVKIFGGECIICRYSRSIQALDFHHLDKTTKSFGVRSCMSLGFNKLLREALKCILLCKNCHTEVENNITQITEDHINKQKQLTSNSMVE